MVVLKGEVSASNRLEAINILAVQFYYYAQENDCDEQAVHEIADGISVAGSFRYQAKTQLYRKLLFCIYAIFPCLNSAQGKRSEMLTCTQKFQAVNNLYKTLVLSNELIKVELPP